MGLLAAALSVVSAAPAPARAQSNIRATPSVHRLPRWKLEHNAVLVGASGGYGYTESLGFGDSAHHRLEGGVGAGLTTKLGLAAEFRLDGRADFHKVGQQSSSGLVGEPRLALRYGGGVGSDITLGAGASLWLPGEEAPSISFKAATVDLLGGMEWNGVDAWTLGVLAGFRADQSAAAAPDAARLPPEHWIALGLSDFHAVLAGLSAVYETDSFGAFAEWTWDVLVGKKAPSPIESPMRLSLGASLPLGDHGTSLTGLVQVLLSGRAPVDVTGPLSPFEPRVQMMLGVRQAFAFGEDAAASEGEPEPEPEPAQDAAVVAAAVPGVTTATVDVSVTGDGGPQSIAFVRLRSTGEAGAEEAPGFEGETDASGKLRLAEIPPGDFTLTVEKDGFHTATQTLSLAAGDQAASVNLEVRPPMGHLRILVRDSRHGRGIRAKLRVREVGSDGEKQAIPTDDKGHAEVELPPGSYEAEVRSYGYAKQRRKFKVEDGSVNVLNVELRKKK